MSDDEEIPDKIVPDLVDLTEWHTRLSVATKILADLHSPMLWASYRKRYRIRRPEQFREIGKRLSELTLDVIGIQDELAVLLNEENRKAYGGEDEA